MEQTSFHQENFRRRTRYTVVFLILAAVFCVVTVLNINTGNVHIPVPKILRILFLKEGAATEYNIIWKIRLPRILDGGTAWWCIISFRLFAADIFFQSNRRTFRSRNFFRSENGRGTYNDRIFEIYRLDFSSYTLILAAFIGSLISTGFILLMSKKVQHMASLLVGGIMIGYICSAITDFVVTFADDSDIVNLHGWSQGSFSGMSWSNVEVAATVIGVTVVLTFFLSKPIGAYQLGEAYAQSMGVNIRFFRVALILLSSVLSASVTAFRRSDLIRGNCCSIPDKACAADIETVGCDTGNIYRRCSILYDL